MPVSIEDWGVGKFYVARDARGRILSRRETSSDYSMANAESDFKKNGWFGSGHVRGSTELANVNERYKYVSTKSFLRDKKGNIVEAKGGKILRDEKGSFITFKQNRLRKPEAPSVQYYVMGTMANGSKVVARSHSLGSPLAKDEDEAYSRAWDSFYRKLSYDYVKKSDANEGRKIFENQVVEIREGWIYYTKK